MTRKNAFGSRLHPANSRQRFLFGFVGCVGFAFAWAVAWVGPTLPHMEAFCWLEIVESVSTADFVS